MINETSLQPHTVDTIKSKIYEIRGQKVMLDKDLAELYQVETKVLNQSVKRNSQRFPSDTMFILTKDEFESLRSQIVTSKKRGGTRYLPFVFTELGVAMLSSVLSSEIAIQVNLNIMRTFVFLRQQTFSLQRQDLRIEKVEHKLDNLSNYVEDILSTQNDINDDTATQLELINQTLAELQTDKTIRKKFEEREPIGFKVDK